MFRTRLLILALLILTLLIGAGCGSSGQNTGSEGTPRPTLHPTFTPTPITPTSIPPTPTPIVDTPTAIVIEPTAEVAVEEVTPVLTEPTEIPPTSTPEVPQVEAIAQTVNLRSGPGTNYSRAGQAKQGQIFPILARDNAGDWFQIERPNGNAVWIINGSNLTRAIGDINTVAVAQNIPTPPPTPKPKPTNTPAPAPTPAPSFAFDLEQQIQWPETNVVRVYLYVYAGDESLPGYSLSVKHNGASLPVNGVSAGGRPSLTWPTKSGRQAFTNLKVEFQQPPAGQWEIQLVDGGGAPAGPPAIFNLTDNDQNRELYVRYKRK